MNFQNIPVRDESYKRIRRACIAPPGGHVWVKCDFNQLELRVLAQASQDTYLVQAYREGRDLHLEGAKVVAAILGKDPVEIRRWAKTSVTFARVYGGGPGKLLEGAAKEGWDMTKAQAALIYKELSAQTPRVEQYRQEVIKQVLVTEESRTLFGRRRRFPGLRWYESRERDGTLREAFNHVIQGTAADIFKFGLLAISPYVETSLVNLVHDEYDFVLRVSSHEACLQDLDRLLTGLEQTKGWVVPLKVEFEVGPNWADLVKYKEDV